MRSHIRLRWQPEPAPHGFNKDGRAPRVGRLTHQDLYPRGDKLPTLSGPSDTSKYSSATAIAVVLSLAGVVVALMQTLVIPIIPRLPEYLNASPSHTAWAITATVLAAGVAMPVMGRLGDMHGKRRMLLISLVFLVAGSILGGLSSTLVPIIIGRALQGLAAGVIPLGISIMRDVLPKERLAGAVAIMSASLGIGGAFGLPSAALISEYANWHVLFWVSAILGALATIGITTMVPESTIRTGGHFDIPGTIALSIALVTLLLAISDGPTWGWGSGLTISMFVVAAVAFLAWGWWELRAPEPLIDVRVSIRPQVLLTNVASIVFGFAMFAAAMVLPQVVQLPEETGYGLGGSLLMSGLVMVPFGALMLMSAPISARITNRYGPKATLMTGAVFVAIGYCAGIFMLHAIWQLIIVAIIIGLGTGLAYAAMPALIMGAVPASQTAAANSFNTLMRTLGTSFASAIAGVILARMTTLSAGVPFPSESAFRLVMVIAAGSAIGAFVVAAFLPSHCAAGISDDFETRLENSDTEIEALAGQ